MCNLSTGTVFSREARITRNDNRILGVIVKLVCKPSIAFIKISHLFSVGDILPLLGSNLNQESQSVVLG